MCPGRPPQVLRLRAAVTEAWWRCADPMRAPPRCTWGRHALHEAAPGCTRHVQHDNCCSPLISRASIGRAVPGSMQGRPALPLSSVSETQPGLQESLHARAPTRVASTPPMTGMDMSMRMMWKASWAWGLRDTTTFTASAPLLATSQVMPRLVSIFRATAWLIRLSSASSTRLAWHTLASLGACVWG